MSAPGIIKIDNLAAGFNGRVLIEGLCADIAPGQRVLIAGASGSGKSTLLRCMLGFTAPVAGTISFGGVRLDGHSVWQLRRRMAYVPQEPIFQHGVVMDILKMPFKYRSNSHLVWDDVKVEGMLERFGFAKNIKTAQSEELSGGEKQRIAIIAAMLLDREYLFLDEPTSALDAASKTVFTDIMRQMKDTTIVLVSHDETNAQIADRRIDITQYMRKAVENVG